MYRLCLFLILFTFSTHLIAQEPRFLLTKEAHGQDLSRVLIKDFSELKFPDYEDRDFWENLPEKIKSAYIRKAERYLDYDWPVVKATDYLEIIRSGDRRQSAYAQPRSALTALVMGELVEGKGRFLDDLVNGVWYYSEQTWWGWSAHLYIQSAQRGLPDVNEPTIDLGVGEVANTLAWTWFLFKEEFDKIHPLIAPRLRQEIMEKAVIPYYEREDFWWMGLEGGRLVNNWNPWTNHNLLTAILILEEDFGKKQKGVRKVLRSLDVFINHYPDDGGCDEGPSYWGRAAASLFQCLDLLDRSTGGAIELYSHPLIQRMGSYIYKAYIDYPYFINFADADATTRSRAQLIYSYGKSTGDENMQNFGAFLAKKQHWGERTPSGKIDEQIMELIHLDEIAEADAENVLISDFWLPDLQIGGARDEEGSSRGFFFAAKGGHNNESHNHNDLGSCVMYYNGKPVIIDLGRETYTDQTFSSRRYEIWTMQSQFHNVPRINGIDQKEGDQYLAREPRFEAQNDKVSFSVDIAKAYPASAQINHWFRSYELHRGKSFRISDRFSLKEVSDQPTTLHLMTYCEVEEKEPGILLLKGGDYELEMQYDARQFSPVIEYYNVEDEGLKRYWPDGVTRIALTFRDISSTGESHIVITPRT